MNEPMNGAAAPPTVLQTLIQKPNGAKIVYTLSNGAYIGTIEFDTASQALLKMLGAEFQAFCAAQTGSLQIAGGAGADMLRTR
jgi:hypothetical protein